MKFIKTIIIITLFANSLHAKGITLDFNSLPSVQGWVYNGNVPEANVFSVSGTVLHQNTIGLGTVFGTGGNIYTLSDVINPDLPFSISVRARVLADEGQDSGFTFGARTGTEGFSIGIEPNRIIDTVSVTGGTVLSTTINNTIFHDYRMDVTPEVGYDFFVDNTLISSVLPAFITRPNELQFGDGTNFANALAEVTSYTFAQADAASGVPFGFNPALGLSLLFSVGIWEVRRRRKIKRKEK